MKCKARILALLLVCHGGMMHADNAGDLPECGIMEREDGHIITFTTPVEALEQLPIAFVAKTDGDDSHWQHGGLEIFLRWDNINKFVLSDDQWAVFAGLHVGMARNEVLQRLGHPIDHLFSVREPLLYSNPNFLDDPGGMCLTEIHLNSQGQVKRIALWWAPMSISPALPNEPPLPPISDK